MVYGEELIKRLEKEIADTQDTMKRRDERIARWETDEDDCFLSIRVEERSVDLAQRKIALIKKGGCEWFSEYATKDGVLVKANWCNTSWGSKLRIEMPDGSVVWSTGGNKSLAKKGLKRVLCLRPAWFAYKTPFKGLYGAYCGGYETFPSERNYATGEMASDEPIEIKDYYYDKEAK